MDNTAALFTLAFVTAFVSGWSLIPGDWKKFLGGLLILATILITIVQLLHSLFR